MVTRNDFELGEEIVDVERRPRAGVVISVRFSPEEADRLQDIAEQHGMTISQVLRRAVAGYLRGAPPDQPALSTWSATVTESARFEVMFFCAPGLRAATSGHQPDESCQLMRAAPPSTD